MDAKRLNERVDLLANECVAGRLRMLNCVVTNIYDAALRPLDVKVSQINLLVAAAKMGAARPTALCQRLPFDVSTPGLNVDRKKARDWREVVPDEDGRQLLEKAFPAWNQAPTEVNSLLGKHMARELDVTVKQIAQTTESRSIFRRQVVYTPQSSPRFRGF